jgi:RHS repeat-associated protein
MTSVPVPGNWASGYNLTYDAWNRLIKVSNLSSSSSGASGSSSSSGARLIASSSSSSSSSSTVATYSYDGKNRRTTKTTNSIRHYYYSLDWQILEERIGASSTPDRQFVWGLRYADDLVLRDQNTSRLYALHDYFNCTAVADTAGAIQERYGYNAFGLVRFMTSSFGILSSSAYSWETLYGDYRWDNESNLYQVRNRFAHPNLGRWLTRDPVGYKAGVNLYAYVENNPVKAVDPTGLAPCTASEISTCMSRAAAKGWIYDGCSALVVQLCFIQLRVAQCSYTDPPEICPLTTTLTQYPIGLPGEPGYLPGFTICVYTCPIQGVIRRYFPQGTTCSATATQPFP